MRKNRYILIFTILSSAWLCACAKKSPQEDVPQKKTEQQKVTEMTTEEETEEKVVSEQDEKSKEYAKILDDVAYVSFGDVIEGAYEESIDFELDEEEVESLKGQKDNIILKDGEIFTLASYRLTLYDEEHNKLDSWIIGWACEAETEEHGLIYGEGEFGDWIDAFEEKYAVKSRNLYARTPGEKYSVRLDDVDQINVYEITANNFIPAIDYDLEEEDIDKLKEIKDEIIIGKEKYEIDENYYHIAMYTDAGAGVYTWVVDHDGKIFTGEGYEISGDAIEEWRQLIEEKSGLADKKETEE